MYSLDNLFVVDCFWEILNCIANKHHSCAGLPDVMTFIYFSESIHSFSFISDFIVSTSLLVVHVQDGKLLCEAVRHSRM